MQFFQRDYIMETEIKSRGYTDNVMSVSRSLPDRPLLAPKEIASVMGYSDEYVRRLVESGAVRATPAAGSEKANVRIYKLSFLDYLQSNQ